MTNPFERTDIDFFVLVNDEGQHSLWPQVIAVPAGWREVFGPQSRDECLAYVDESWWDIRPASLIGRMA